MGEWAYPDEMARLYEKASKETDFGGKHFLSQFFYDWYKVGLSYTPYYTR
jgi:hypothetical protein